MFFPNCVKGHTWRCIFHCRPRRTPGKNVKSQQERQHFFAEIGEMQLFHRSMSVNNVRPCKALRVKENDLPAHTIARMWWVVYSRSALAKKLDLSQRAKVFLHNVYVMSSTQFSDVLFWSTFAMPRLPTLRYQRTRSLSSHFKRGYVTYTRACTACIHVGVCEKWSAHFWGM